MKSNLSFNKMQNFERERGVVLFVVLVFLLISTLIGVTSLRSNVLNEKMTLNAIQREEALQAAEATLLFAEDLIENNNSEILNVVLNGRNPRNQALTCEAQLRSQGGICVKVGATPAYNGNGFEHWRDITGDPNSINAWSTRNRHRELDDPAIIRLLDLNSPPKYIIEFMGYSSADGNPANSACNQSGQGANVQAENNSWPYCSIDRSVYRITALATSGNKDETRVMLQSTYVVDNT